MQAKKFKRTKEDFICDNCRQSVKGTGYTNHCPRCLWSKHVDENPGDRKEKCQGMMEPIGIEKKGSNFYILHKCIKCGFQKKNIREKDDSFDELIKLSNI